MKEITTKPSYLMIFATILVTSAAFSLPEMLTDSLSTTFGEFDLTSGGNIVFINSNGTLSSVNINEPFAVDSFSIGWMPEDNGWNGAGEIRFLKSSPDGELLCIAIQVSVPDSILSRGLAMPEPVIILVCNSTGGEAQIAGIADGSPEVLSFDFTQDSRLLYGAGFLRCTPDPRLTMQWYWGMKQNCFNHLM